MFFTYSQDNCLYGINLKNVVSFKGARDKNTEELRVFIRTADGKAHTLYGQELYAAFIQEVARYNNDSGLQIYNEEL